MKEIAIADTLHSLLAQNIVFFTFRKVNGEIRHAKGTRNLTLAEIRTNTNIPRPKGQEQPNSYFDIEKMGWRSYKPENVISIDGVLPLTDTKKPELPKREIPIRKSTGNGGADIDKILGGIFSSLGMPMGEISNPTAPKRGIELPIGSLSADEFARLIAKYVVDEFVSRIKG